MTGLILPLSLPSTRSSTSSARSTTSVCGIFLVADDDVGGGDALQGEMAVRIELDADHAALADDGAGALDDVALHVVVAVGDHGAVQAEQHAVDRHGGPQLSQNLVAHELVVGPVGGARRAGGEAAALHQREALRGGAPAADEQRCRAHARGIGGVLAGPVEHAFLVGREARRQGREGIGLGGERGGEQAHGALRAGPPVKHLSRAPGRGRHAHRPWFDPRNKSEGRQAQHCGGGDPNAWPAENKEAPPKRGPRTSERYPLRLLRRPL